MMKLAAAAVLMCAIAQPLQAQTHAHGAGHAQAQTHGAEHEGAGHAHDDAAHRFAPMMILKHSDMLKLTPAQVQQLEGLQAAHHALCEPRMAAIKAAEADAEAALRPDAMDIARFEAKLREAANLKVDCKVDMARTSQKALALLTAEQKQHMSHMAAGGHGGHGGH